MFAGQGNPRISSTNMIDKTANENCVVICWPKYKRNCGSRDLPDTWQNSPSALPCTRASIPSARKRRSSGLAHPPKAPPESKTPATAPRAPAQCWGRRMSTRYKGWVGRIDFQNTDVCAHPSHPCTNNSAFPGVSGSRLIRGWPFRIHQASVAKTIQNQQTVPVDCRCDVLCSFTRQHCMLA